MSDPCPRCDQPIATQTDHDACPGGCECTRCVSLCWSAFGSACVAVDWRSRALTAEAERDEWSGRAKERARHALEAEAELKRVWSIESAAVAAHADKVEAATIERVAAWLESSAASGFFAVPGRDEKRLADRLRSGTWKEKP